MTWTTGRVVSGLALLAAGSLAGATLGLLWVKLFVPRRAMGWDGIADAIGGGMLGALLGLVIAAAMVAAFSLRAQRIAIVVALVIVALVFGGLVLTAPKREPSPPPVVKQAFQPVFRVGLRVSHTREILAAVPPAERPLPFVETEVSTGKPELIRVAWGPGFERCVATPSEPDLRALVPRIRATAAAKGPYCRTPEDDLSLSAHWNLAGEHGSQGLHAGCLPEHPQLQALIDAVAELADRLCAAEPT